MATPRELTDQERSRLDTEWMTLSALRDGMVFAHGINDVSYRQAFALGKIVATELYDNVSRILDNPRESIPAQEIRQLAAAQSVATGKPITALEYIEEKIAETRRLIKADEDQNLLDNILHRYENIRQEIKPRKSTETKLIFGDAERTSIGLPLSDKGEGYADFRLNPNRILRVRVTHMEAPEAKIGADLVYENIDFSKKTARIVMIQYKMWESYDYVFHWKDRDQKQYNRLESAACKHRLCGLDTEIDRSFRLPNCAAFIRPTDRLQEPNSNTKSSGLHIPVCVVKDAWRENQAGGKSIRKSQIEARSLSHRVFGELFDHCMVGSKEITWEHMESLYKGYNIFDADDRVTIHIQDAKNLQSTTIFNPPRKRSAAGKARKAKG
jgi:hypothetical protein